jgi:hypothetical protein
MTDWPTAERAALACVGFDPSTITSMLALRVDRSCWAEVGREHQGDTLGAVPHGTVCIIPGHLGHAQVLVPLEAVYDGRCRAALPGGRLILIDDGDGHDAVFLRSQHVAEDGHHQDRSYKYQAEAAVVAPELRYDAPADRQDA